MIDTARLLAEYRRRPATGCRVSVWFDRPEGVDPSEGPIIPFSDVKSALAEIRGGATSRHFSYHGGVFGIRRSSPVEGDTSLVFSCGFKRNKRTHDAVYYTFGGTDSAKSGLFATRSADGHAVLRFRTPPDHVTILFDYQRVPGLIQVHFTRANLDDDDFLSVHQFGAFESSDLFQVQEHTIKMAKLSEPNPGKHALYDRRFKAINTHMAEVETAANLVAGGGDEEGGLTLNDLLDAIPRGTRALDLAIAAYLEQPPDAVQTSLYYDVDTELLVVNSLTSGFDYAAYITPTGKVLGNRWMVPHLRLEGFPVESPEGEVEAGFSRRFRETFGFLAGAGFDLAIRFREGAPSFANASVPDPYDVGVAAFSEDPVGPVEGAGAASAVPRAGGGEGGLGRLARAALLVLAAAALAVGARGGGA